MYRDSIVCIILCLHLEDTTAADSWVGEARKRNLRSNGVNFNSLDPIIRFHLVVVYFIIL